MSMTVDDICAEVMALPNESKAHLVDLLLADMAEHREPDVEQAQLASVRRRIEEVRTGAVRPVPAAEVLASVRKILEQ